MSTSMYWDAGIVSVISVGTVRAPSGIPTTVFPRLRIPPRGPMIDWAVCVVVVGQMTRRAVPGSGGGVGGVSQLRAPPRTTRAAANARIVEKGVFIATAPAGRAV